MAPLFPLGVVVHADADVRLDRLVHRRGMAQADAKSRIAAQATDDQRRAVADVWLDNSGTEGDLVERVRDLWFQRILPFSHNLAIGRPAPDPDRLVPADPDWVDQAGRIAARLRTACGHRALRVDHIGSTAVPGLDARDIIDMQVTVASLDLADELAGDLLRAGYPRVASIIADAVLGGSESVHPKRFHASADPGRPTHVHIRVAGTSPQQFALLFVDWLASHPGVCPDYLAAKRAGPQSAAQWLGQAHSRARSWAESTGWSPVS